jgi:zinc transport system permease protein
LADISFAAIALALNLQLPPTIVCIPVAILCSFLIIHLSQNGKMHGDISIGVFSTGALAVGAMISSMSKRFNTDIYSYMFGSVLAIDDVDIAITITLSLIILVLFLIFYNRFFLITSDETFAKISGINVMFYNFLISFMTALTVVTGMRVVGTLLISSLTIFPALIAKKISRNFKSLVFFSVIISSICFILGMIISFSLNTPTGASIVIANILILCLVLIFEKKI